MKSKSYLRNILNKAEEICKFCDAKNPVVVDIVKMVFIVRELMKRGLSCPRFFIRSKDSSLLFGFRFTNFTLKHLLMLSLLLPRISLRFLENNSVLRIVNFRDFPCYYFAKKNYFYMVKQVEIKNINLDRLKDEIFAILDILVIVYGMLWLKEVYYKVARLRSRQTLV